MKTKIKTLKCKRCGHEWYPRQPDVRICPNCKSARWDTERKNKVKDMVLDKDKLSEIKDLVNKTTKGAK